MPLTIPITEIERQRRTDTIGQALASVRLDGLEPGDAALAIFDRYVNGELTQDEMGAEIEALHDRKYGPVHVSRDDRP